MQEDKSRIQRSHLSCWRALHWRSWLILALFIVEFLGSNFFVAKYTTGMGFHDGYYYNGRGFGQGTPATYRISLRYWCRGRENEPLTEQVSLPETVKFSLPALTVNFLFFIAMTGIVLGISEAIHRRRFSLLALLIWLSLWAVVLGLGLYAPQISVKPSDLTPPVSLESYSGIQPATAHKTGDLLAITYNASDGPAIKGKREDHKTMTDHQQELYDMLLDFPRTEAAKKAQKRSPMEFVLQHGWWYDPCQMPEGIEQGTEQECYKNTQLLAHDRDSLNYCEGFALAHSGSLMILHGWVTDGTGRAIDVTWPQPGIAYAGVPFKKSFIRRTCLTNSAFISVIDDWQNGYPLLNALGDNPDEWLERELGNGVARLDGGRAR